MFTLKTSFTPTGDQPQAIESLVAGLEKGAKHQVLLGVTGSGKTFTMANVIAQVKKPTLVMAHNKTLAAQLYQEYKQFFPKNAVEYFVSYYDYYQPEAYLPATDTYIDKDASINEEIDKLRLAATSALLTRKDVIVVASVSAIYNIGSPETYKRAFLRLKKDLRLDRQDLITRLTQLYYERNDVTFSRGLFRVRGETIDLWPTYMDIGIRLQLEGGKLIQVSLFHPVSGQELDQQGLERLLDSHEVDPLALQTFVAWEQKQELIIYPGKHYVVEDNTREKALAEIEADLAHQVKKLKAAGKEIEAYRLKKRTEYDLEMIREIGYCKGIENYSIYFDQRDKGQPPHSLLDFFGDDYLMIIDESHMSVPQIRGMYEGDRSRKQTLIDYGFRLPSALENRPLKFDEFLTKINQVVYTSATPGEWEIEKAKKEAKRLGLDNQGVVEQLIRPTGLVDPPVVVKPAKGQIPDLIKEIKKRVKKHQRVLVTTLTKRQAEDLAEFLAEEEIKVHYLHSDIKTLERVEVLRDLRLGEVDVIVGVNLLREGLDLPEVSLVAILDADKEGFLRSHTALIQTMGRAARHVFGEVIVYADKLTGSLRRALDEVARRRQKQLEYNRKHNITPRSTTRALGEELVGLGKADPKLKTLDLKHDYKQATGQDSLRSDGWAGSDFSLNVNQQPGVSALTQRQKQKLIAKLRRQMKKAANNLDFELAAQIRDRIQEIERETSF